ncbi:MAG: hypothetical protein JWO42_450, partial [Chloroflexi bacterium]|nr:hypothetical protein [Chloroflexota bacterium]
ASRIEFQAECYAGELLCPTTLVEALCAARGGIGPKAGRWNHTGQADQTQWSVTKLVGAREPTRFAAGSQLY